MYVFLFIFIQCFSIDRSNPCGEDISRCKKSRTVPKNCLKLVKSWCLKRVCSTNFKISSVWVKIKYFVNGGQLIKTKNNSINLYLFELKITKTDIHTYTYTKWYNIKITFAMHSFQFFVVVLQIATVEELVMTHPIDLL